MMIRPGFLDPFFKVLVQLLLLELLPLELLLLLELLPLGLLLLELLPLLQLLLLQGRMQSLPQMQSLL